MAADTVLGEFQRERLPDALAALHRHGYGGNARVLDAGRGDLVGQLRRAGIAEPPQLGGNPALLLMVFAPGRVAAVADLLRRTGARTLHLTERSGDGLPAAGFRAPLAPRPVTGRQDEATTGERS